jgi:hypothetical protein
LFGFILRIDDVLFPLVSRIYNRPTRNTLSIKSTNAPFLSSVTLLINIICSNCIHHIHSFSVTWLKKQCVFRLTKEFLLCVIKKLTSISAWSRVSHRQNLADSFKSVNSSLKRVARTSRTISSRISTLNHKIFDDAVKFCKPSKKWFLPFRFSFFALQKYFYLLPTL